MDYSDENKETKKQKDMLSRYPPVTTLLIQSIGPFAIQLTSALYGFIQTIWVSKGLGKDGLSAISTASAFDNIGRALGYFVSSAGAAKISALFKANNENEAEQVLCDLIRVAILFACIPACLIPLYKPVFRWFGADSHIVKMAYNYMIPLSTLSFGSLLYLSTMGFLNAEGRSYISGGITILSSIFNQAFLCPLLIVWRPIGIQGVAYASIIAEGSAAFLILILYFCGVFSVKPQFKQLFQRFSSETWSSLRVGLSSLAASISLEIPGIFLRRLIGMACGGDTEKVKNALSGIYILFKFLKVPNSVILGLSHGYLPAASYSYAGSMYKRWYTLSLAAVLISFFWGGFSTILSWVIPDRISLLFINDRSLLEYSVPMLKYGNALGFLSFSRFIIPGLLQSMMMGIRATFLSLSSQLGGMLGFSYLFYLAYKNDPPKIVWSMSLSYALQFIIGSLILWKPVKVIIKEMKEETDEPLKLDLITSEL